MTSPHWQLTSGFDPLWHTWEDEAIIFDRFSGNTHLLDTLSAELIQLLMKAPAEQERLVKHAAELHGYEHESALAEMIQVRLRRLTQLGIAECQVS